ncbi:MAG: T9SS type A sorting domain-containing protein [Bacteroidota bacterium]
MTRSLLILLALVASVPGLAQQADVTVTGRTVVNGARLVVTGDLTVISGATLDAEEGGLVFSGAGDQTLAVQGQDGQPFPLRDLLVDKPLGEVSVFVRPQITGVLGLYGGVLNFEEGTARLAAFVSGGEVQSLAAVDGSGATLTGDLLDYERPFLDGEGWRMIASPFAANFTSLNDDVHTQGATGAVNPDGEPNVIAWDPTQPDGSRYVGVTDFAQPMEPGRGYFLYGYAVSPSGSGAFPATWDVTGEENAGAIPQPLSYSPTDTDAQWNLLGNPFAGPLDWATVQAAGDFQDAYAVWDPGANGGLGAYAYYSTVGGATGDAGETIPPFQGFWAQTSNTSPGTLAFDPAWKSIGESPVFVGKAPVTALRFRLEGEGLEAPDARALFTGQGEVGRDRADGSWLTPLSREWAALRFVRPGDGSPLVFDSRAAASRGHTLELGVETTTPGRYTLTWPEAPPGADLVLHDRETGATVDLASRTSYAFTIAGSARGVPRATGENRLTLSAPGDKASSALLKTTGSAARFEVRVAGGARLGLDLAATTSTEVEAGGQFRMDATFTLSESAPGRVTYWTEATLPNGTVVGPIVGPRTLRATPGTTVTKRITQRLPSRVLPGAYLYRMMVRLPDGHVVAVDELRLDVAASASKSASENWVATDAEGTVLTEGGVDDLTTAIAPSAALSELPNEPTLSPPSPNPARGASTVTFALPESAEVRVSVFDALGREVAVLAEGRQSAGTHTAPLTSLPAGTYIVRFQTGETAQTQRLTVIR